MREGTLQSTRNPKFTTFLPSSSLPSFSSAKAGTSITSSTPSATTTNLTSLKTPENFSNPVLIFKCLISKMTRCLHIIMNKIKKNLMFKLKKFMSASLISRLYNKFHHFLDFCLLRILPYLTLKPNHLNKIMKVQSHPSKKTREIPRALKYSKTQPVPKT